MVKAGVEEVCLAASAPEFIRQTKAARYHLHIDSGTRLMRFHVDHTHFFYKPITLGQINEVGLPIYDSAIVITLLKIYVSDCKSK